MLKKLKRFYLLITYITVFHHAQAQTDTVFWFAAPDVTIDHGDRPVIFRFASFEEAARVKISLPGLNEEVQTIDIPANSERNYTVNTPDFLEVEVGNIQNNGILIESSANITAYYEVIGGGNNTEIYALKGKYALGKEFIIPFQTRFPNQTFLDAYASVSIVATEDNTEIIFIPSKEVYLHLGEDTIKLILNKGQTYAFSALDESVKSKLAGSRILASKPIAVTHTDDSVLNGYNWDLIGDQVIPINYAGKKYVLPIGWISLSSKNPFTTSTDTTVIDLNISNNFSQTFFNENPRVIDFPDTTVVLFIDQEEGASGGELGGAILPPLTCSGSRQVSFVRSSPRPFYLYLVYRTSSKDSFLLNNAPFSIDEESIYIIDSNLSYAKVTLDATKIPINQANRISNSFAPFHVAIANGDAYSGFQLGYFSNFRNDLLDTVYVCEPNLSFDELKLALNIYGSMTLDTLSANTVDSTYLSVQVIDEYCIIEDSVWVIESSAPMIPIADTLTFCNDLDSSLFINEYKVVYDDFFEQNTWPLSKDSVKILVENKAGCKSNKTVYVTYLDSVLVNFPEDRSFCQGDSVAIEISGVYDSLWVNEMLSVDTFTLKQDTVLRITGANSCGISRDTVSIVKHDLPRIDLGLDRTLCEKTYTVELPNMYRYKWQDGSTKASYTFTKTATYSVKVTDSNFCLFSDTLNLVLKQFDPIRPIGNRKICPNEPLQLQLEKGHDSYTWTDGDSVANRTLGVGNYSVTIQTSSNDTLCYQAAYDFSVSEWKLNIPNVITPNNDDKNEFFVIEGLDSNYAMHLEIYNRWGKRVFRDDDYQNTWGNLELSEGVYYYQTSVGDFECVRTKGFISVIR